MGISKDFILYFEKNWAIFAGSFHDNIPHRHYAIQISITTGDDIVLRDDKQQEFRMQRCIIRNNQIHQFMCNSPQLSLYLNPTSAVGHYFNKIIPGGNIVEFNHPIATNLRELALQLLSKQLAFQQFVTEIRSLLENISNICLSEEYYADERIRHAISYLEDHADEVVPLETIAAVCYLSPSRFLHLFKETTGINYRRLQLWIKVSNSFNSLFSQPITQTAHQYGFTDSAHYCRAFKENFGFSPSQLARLAK